MKRVRILVLLAIAGILMLAATIPSDTATERSESSFAEATLCGSSSGTVAPASDGKFIKPLRGWGNRDYPVSTRNDSAQFYFNQGLGFYYGYHFTEALASFKESSRHDPACAMSYWGQALAMGPYYNTYVYRMPAAVPEVVGEMLRNATRVNDRERALIAAMQQRYSTDMTNADRPQLNRAYSSALELLVAKYPDDSDIGALYIDAIMLEHKWDFWSVDGLPKPWTNPVISLSESILNRDKHPAVLHYYIHLVEASRTPHRALASANLLKDVNPGIGHMVHMSSHMYQRNGLYVDGVSINEVANAVNNEVDMRIPELNMGQNRSTHIFAVQSFCAMTAGMYKNGMPIYERARTRQVELSADLQHDTYGQFVYMMPVLAHVRLGRWQEILASAAPDSVWKYATVLDQFGRGLANVRQQKLAAARENLQVIKASLDDSLLAVRHMPFNSPAQSCRIAAAILEGEILFQEGSRKEALAMFNSAIDEEDRLVYREPHDWVIPARQFLGKYQMEMNNLSDAEATYREDLIDNPGNGWSLTGLSECLKRQGRNKDSKVFAAQARKAFESADVTVMSSVF